MIWIVERNKKLNDENDTDPMKVLLRQNVRSGLIPDSSRAMFGMVPEIIENVTLLKLSDLGLSPKVFGIYDGGRVDEFIDCSILTATQSKEPDIKRDIAISLARIHSTDVPIAKVPKDVFISAVQIKDTFFQHQKESFLTSEALKKAGVDVQTIVDFDYDTEFKWLKGALDKFDFQRSVLSLMDLNFENCLVRKNPPPGLLKVLLIDYEFSSYRFRGYDIFSHFMFRMVRIKDNDRSGEPYPSEDDRRDFIRMYLNEFKRLGCRDFDENGLDSVDHVLGEVELCGLLCLLWNTLTFITCHSKIAPLAPGLYVSQ